MTHTSFRGGIPATRLQSAFALLFALTIACRDATEPVIRSSPAEYDLVFDGEDALGRSFLFRASVDGTTPTPIGGGIER